MWSCAMFLPVFYNSVMKENLWPDNISEAREIQRALKEKVKIAPLKKVPELIAAADAAFSGDLVFAAASLYKLPALAHLLDVFFGNKGEYELHARTPCVQRRKGGHRRYKKTCGIA